LVVDVSKGIIAVTLLASLCYAREVPITFNVFRALLGLSTIAGHNWSIFLKFKGGKGVATSCGVLMILLPKATAIAILIFLITVWITRYVSLGSILLSATVPIAAALLGREIELIILAVTLCILISYRHKANIKRLLRGAENKIGTM
jgi:glycerol-3-phosphate acyltransferase PlsY